jgi:mono/diheme cytochrome c family protein
MIKYLFFVMAIVIVAVAITAFTPAQINDVKASVKRGEKVYTKVCMPCHMADGGGVPNMNPPLIQTSYVLGDKPKLIGIVLHGMNERVPIDGDYYSNNMAPHNDLTDQQIADVLTYVRNSFGSNGSAVTPTEVTQARLKKQ